MKNFSFAFLILTTLMLFGLTDLKSQTFARTYSFPGMNGGLSLAPTSDGGFVGTGQHEGGPGGSCDVYAYKVSSCGSLLWYKTLGSVDSDGGRKITEAADGGLLITGLWDGGGGNGYDWGLIKLNQNGVFQWSNIWNNSAVTTQTVADERGIWVTQMPNNIAVTGWAYDGPFTGWNGAISMYSNAGAHLWTKEYGGAAQDYLGSIHYNGTFLYAAGITSSFGAGSNDLWIVKTDAAGNPVWMKTYGTTAAEGREWDTEGLPTPDGGFIIAGATTNTLLTAGAQDILVVKVDAAGVVQWAKTYGGTGDQFSEGIVSTPDGGYMVVGTTYGVANGPRDAVLLKLDVNGNLIWAKAYGGPGCDNGIEVISYGSSYILSMNTNTAACGVNAEYDPMFVRTDSVGNVGCANMSLTYSTMLVTGSIITGTVPISAVANVSSSLTIINPNPILGAPIPNEQFVCIACSPTTPSITVSPTVACDGELITFSNLTATNTAACFQWFANGNTLPISSSGISTTTFAPGTYTIEMQSVCGNTVSTSSKTLIINPNPTANFTFTNNICEDKQANYLNTGTTGAGFSYAWSLGTGAAPATSTTQDASNISYAYAGIKTVTLVTTNQFGCKNTIIKSASIEPAPTLNFVSSSPSCINSATSFTNTTWIGGSGVIASWLWDFGNGVTSNTFAPVNTYTAAGTYTVMLVATSDYGCDDTLYNNVTISPATVPGSVQNNTNVCATANGGTLTLAGNTGNVLYWNYSNDGGVNWSPLSNTSTLQAYANLSQTTIYQAYVKSGACPGAMANSATITVNAASNAGVLKKDTVVCSTSNSGVLSLSSYSGSVLNWLTSTNNGTSWTNITNTLSTYTFSNVASSAWFASVVKNGICPADTSNNVKVNVLLFQGASVSPSTNTTISMGYSLQVVAAGGVQYAWAPNYNISDTSIYNPNVWPNKNTTYTVIVQNSYGCRDTAQVTVLVTNDYKVIIANTMTPNNDGFNDTWWIGNLENYPNNEVMILNRYGQLLFETKGYKNNWDGTYNGQKLPDGTYYYVLKFPDGNIVYKGSINIVNGK